MEHQFRITRTDTTKAAAESFLHELDPQIDELQEQLALLQGVRRAVAATFGFDRREGKGMFGQAADRAKRAEYEGDGSVDADGRFKPSDGDSPMKARLVPRPAEEEE